MKSVFLLGFAAASVFAQPLSVGVKGGVPITDFFETAKGNQSSYFTNTKRYLVGPTVEFRFPLGLAIEVDALYRRLGFDYTQVAPGGTVFASTSANSWQFPLLAKWAFLPGPVKPFVDGGATFQHITGVKQIRSALSSTPLSNNVAEFNEDTDIGFTFGGGIELKLGIVRISPEFRYTRWGSDVFRDPVQTLLNTNRNQGDFLLGITF
jgi:opacity protein-like surface antigen